MLCLLPINPWASVLCRLKFKSNLGEKCEIVCVEKFSSVNNLLSSGVLTLPRSLAERNPLQFNSLNKYVLCVMWQAQCQAGQRVQRGEKDGTSLLEKVPGNSTSK